MFLYCLKNFILLPYWEFLNFADKNLNLCVLLPLMPISAAMELALLSLIPLISIEARALRHSSRVKICRINFILLSLIWV